MKLFVLFSVAWANSFVETIISRQVLSSTVEKTANGQVISWKEGKQKYPHLIQEFNSQGSLVREKSDQDQNQVFERVMSVIPKTRSFEERFDDNQDGIA